MEHRWGNRHDTNKSVRLRTAGGAAAQGRVLNVSVSGAFVSTHLPAPVLSHIQVSFEVGHWDGEPATIDAQVIRRTAQGLALEWTEFAPEAVWALMQPAAPHPRELADFEARAHRARCRRQPP
jgi:PilZ domain